MPFSREEADHVAAQLMEAAPPNVPSNGRRRQQAPLLKSARSGSFKGLFGFNKGEALLLATPGGTGTAWTGASCSHRL